MRGERLGFGGWLRFLGFQEKEPPQRHWDIRHVAIVSDESDLTSASNGPRAIFGGQIAGALNARSVIEVMAGSRGCRVGIDLQVGDPTGALVLHQIAQFKIADGLSSLVSVPTAFPMSAQNGTPVHTFARHGRMTDADYATEFPTLTAAYAIKPTSVGGVSQANSFFHIGTGNLYRPFLWLDPGKTLFIAGTQTGNAVGWYVSAYVEEPGSARD